jgi:hypothetical protein
MRRRSLIVFILLNVLISVGVVVGILSLLNRGNTPVEANQVIVTVPILVTATTDPNATPRVVIITATPLPGSVGVLPTGILETSAAPLAGLETADAQAINPVDVAASGQAVATVLPENCILHTIVDGDTPYGVALQYGADFFRVMEVNGLNDETASLLQIGDQLIVPLEGCPLTGPITTPAPTVESADASSATEEATAEATPELFTATPTLRPTLTLPPTAVNAQVEIAEVRGVGDITAESVVIRNNGNNVNMRGWTISDAQDNTYTFAERILFSQGLVTVNSRVGQDTPVALFWNRTAPAFEPGDVVTLRDNQGVVQSSFRVPGSVDLP